MTNKKAIYNRLISTWEKGLRGDYQYFAPILDKIGGALSEELSTSYQELNNFKASELRQLAGLLLPEKIWRPLPSDSILYGLPLKKNAKIRSSDLSIKIEQRGGNIVDFISPFDIPLNKIGIKYIGTIHFLYDVEKETIIGDEKEVMNEMFIGINTNNIEGIKEMLLHRNDPNGNLHNCIWRNDKNEVSVHDGINFSMKEGFEYLGAKYKHNFTSLKFQGSLTSSVFPTPLKNNLKLSLEMEKEELSWLRISLSKSLSKREIVAMDLRFNCFPIVNLKENTAIRKGHLKLPEQHENETVFYAIDPVDGEQFYELINPTGNYLPINEISLSKFLKKVEDIHLNKDDHDGSYMVWSGSLERFDKRTLQELLEYMDWLSVEERHLFDSRIPSLSKFITKEESGHRPFAYVVFKPTKDNAGNNPTIKYWTTQGADVNTEDAYHLTVKSPDLNKAELRTPILGGRNKPSDNQFIKEFRKHLLSRGKIYTKHDIKLHCETFVGDELKELIISDQFRVSELEHVGFERVIYVSVIVKSGWDLKKQLILQQEIDTLSCIILPIQIVLKYES